MWYLFPGESLPNCETDCYCRIEVTTRRRCAGYDSEGDAYSKSPSDRKNPAKCCDANGRFKIERESSNCCNAREPRCVYQSQEYLTEVRYALHVEEHARRLSHAFSQDTRSLVFEVKFPLRNRFLRNDMPGHMLLHSFGGTKLHCNDH